MPQPTPSQVQQIIDRGLTLRSIPVRPGTVNEEDRSVEVILTTDTPVRVFDWSRWDIVDETLRMDGASVPEQIPLLDSHDRYTTKSLFGSVHGIRRESINGMDTLVGRAFFSATKDADEMWTKVKEGHLRDFSIGYQVEKSEIIEAKTTKSIDGKSYTAGDLPLRVSSGWNLKELSATAIGADVFAKVRCDAALALGDTAGLSAGEKTPQQTGERQMPDELKEQTPKEETRAAAAVASPNAQEIADAARAEERGRVKLIMGLCREFEASTELETKALNECWDEAKLRAAIMDEFKAKKFPQGPAGISIETGQDLGREVLPVVLSNAMCMRYGVKLSDKERDEAKQFDGIGLQDVARMAIEAETGKRMAFTPPEALYHRAISTGTFTELLSTSAYKTLQASYTEYPGTAQSWAGTRTVKDFKDMEEIGLSGFTSMETLATGGKFKHATLSEKSESYSVETYGLMFGISRKMMINDDLGGFMRIPQRLGVVAKRNVDDVFYDMLVSNSGVGPTMNEDSHPLFYASRTTKNYLTSATYILGSSGLSNLKLTMRKIAGMEGQVLNIQPRYLVIPPELEETAKLLMVADSLFATGVTSSRVVEVNKNIHSMSPLEIVVEPRLSAATNGTTAWYLVADPRVQDSVALIYLAGNEQPTLETCNPTDELGYAWRIYHDVGAAAIDWRGIAKSDGA